MEIKKRGKRTIMTRAIYKYLLTTSPKTIIEIKEYLNGRYKYAPDYHGLSTIMGRSKYFKKVGSIDTEQVSGGNYKLKLWTVMDE